MEHLWTQQNSKTRPNDATKLLQTPRHTHESWKWTVTAVSEGTVHVSRGYLMYNFHGHSWLPRVALRHMELFCCFTGSNEFCSNILGQLVVSTSHKPSMFTFRCLYKEPIECITHNVHQLAGPTFGSHMT